MALDFPVLSTFIKDFKTTIYYIYLIVEIREINCEIITLLQSHTKKLSENKDNFKIIIHYILIEFFIFNVLLISFAYRKY